MDKELSAPHTNPSEWINTDMVRNPVRVFANAMELKLKVNDYKGGWQPERCSIAYLKGRLKQEIHEYETSSDPRELLDIANFCMMIADKYAEERG